MIRHFIYPTTILLFFAIITFCAALPVDTTPDFHANKITTTGKIELVKDTPQGVTIQLNIEKSDLKINIEEQNSQLYQTLSFPNCRYTTGKGLPRIPMQTTLIGVPSDTNFTVHIVDRGDFSTFTLPHKIANSRDGYIEELSEQKITSNNIYTTNQYIPQDLAEIGSPGWIRDNRILPIQVYPIQYNPVTGMVKLYHRLVVEVRFKRLANAPSPVQRISRPESSVYQKTFENLIVNPKTANQWRSPVNQQFTNNESTANLYLKNPSFFSLPAAGRYKILTDQSGMYRITASDLAAAGIDLPTIKVSTLTLSNKGRHVPILVRNATSGQEISVTGDNFTGFDPEGEIIFYAQRHSGDKTYIDPYSDENIYWLTWNAGPGLRMETKTVSVDASLRYQPRNFLTRVHFEKDNQFRRFKDFGLSAGSEYDDFGEGLQERHFQLNSLPDLPDDSWFWAQLSAPTTRDFPFTINGVAGTGNKATIRIALHGRSVDTHFAELWLNNDIIIGTPRWEGDIEYILENTTVSQSFLKNGRNTFRAVLPGSQELDLLMLNWFEVDYWRNYKATNNVLPFAITLIPDETGIVNPNFRVELKNFNTPDIEIYGIDGTRYVGLSPQQDEDLQGKYNVVFQSTQIEGTSTNNINQPLNTEIQYIALTRDQYLTPIDIIKDSPSDLRNSNNAADYIIITDTEFIREVQPLASFRSQQGLRSKIVTVEDIYDEFNHGIPNPYALRDFLKYAYENWQSPAPTYVLLVGDTNLQDKSSTVPTIQVQIPGYGSSASDYKFVTFRGNDNFPEMFIGRVPVSHSVDVRVFVERAINYETNADVGPWHKRILMLAGSDERFHFQTDLLTNASHLTDKYETVPIYAPPTPEDELPLGEASTPVGRQVINGFNDGASLVNYIGHGGGGVWSSSRMMDLEDPEKNLTNIARMPFVISMTCFTGEFDSPTGCLAEALLQSESGGAIAVIGGTSIGLLDGDFLLNQEIFEVMFNDKTEHIGAILAEAKTQFLINSPGYLDLTEVFTLFGDPATRLRLPHTEMELTLNLNDPKQGNNDREDTLLNVTGSLPIPDFTGDAEITVIPNPPERREKRRPIGQRNIKAPLVRSIDNLPRTETVSVVDGKFNTQMQIPYNSAFDALKLRVYAWNTQEDAIGYTSYTPLERFVKNVRLEPDPVPPNEPVHVYAQVVNNTAINAMSLYWSYQVIDDRRQVRDVEKIPMVHQESGIYRTEFPIPAAERGDLIDYYLLVEPKDERILQTKVVTYGVGEPDFSVLGHTIHWSTDASFHLSAQIKNFGDISGKDVPVYFLQLPVNTSNQGQEITLADLKNATPIGVVQIIPEIPPDEYVIASVPWKPHPGEYTVTVFVDMPTDEQPRGIIKELREFNNSSSREFVNNTVFLNSDNIDQPIQSIDGAFRITIPKDSLQETSTLLFETQELIIKNQPDIINPSGIEQAAPTAYHINLNQQSELTGTATFVTKTEVNSHIYMRDDETGNWIRVGNQSEDGETISAEVKLPGTFALLSHSDNRPPVLELTVEDQGFVDGDYISDIPTITARIVDANGIDPRPDNIILTKNGNRVLQSEYIISTSPTSSNVLLLTYSPDHALPAGEYRIRLQALDANGNTAETELNGKVAGGLEIKNIANFPNPFRPGKGTDFAYYLTENADTVSLKIYTLTGRLIRNVDTLDADTSYNEYHFDGLDEDGDPLANGVYIYKFTATKNDERVQKVGKILILK
ncbi:T9SS type A sorting domain-containing protein [Candidatus Poribacteria bacterium]|nr:T9SS type A sorting domain-containing protein [Candidatus Poribacteria bacterium]